MPVKDPNALAKLQAYANGGQAAVDAWNRSQAVANQAQQAALSTAGSVATNGAAEQAALSKIVGDYTSPTQGALSSGADFAVTEAANYSRAGQSELNRTLDELNAKQARADAKRKLDLELAQQDYDLGMTKVRNENDLTQRQANQLTAAQVNDAVMAGGQQLQAADRDKFTRDAAQQITDMQTKYVDDENARAELDLLNRVIDRISKGEARGGAESQSFGKGDFAIGAEMAAKYGLDWEALQAQAVAKANRPAADPLTGSESLPVSGPLGSRTDGRGPTPNGSGGAAENPLVADAVRRATEDARRATYAPQSLAEATAAPGLGSEVQNPAVFVPGIPTTDERTKWDQQQQALQQMLADYTGRAGGANVEDRAAQVQNWRDTNLDRIEVNPMQYQQRAATAGGMDPWVAMGAYPDTPTERFKQQQALDAMRDYDAKRQLAEDKRDVQGDKTNRTQQINDLAEATGLDPTAVQSLVTKTKLPPDKLGTVLRDDQSLGELQQAVDAALGNGTTYTEFMNSMRDQLTAKQKAGQMPEGMTVTDYLNFIGANYRDQFTQLGLTGG